MARITSGRSLAAESEQQAAWHQQRERDVVAELRFLAARVDFLVGDASSNSTAPSPPFTASSRSAMIAARRDITLPLSAGAQQSTPLIATST